MIFKAKKITCESQILVLGEFIHFIPRKKSQKRGFSLISLCLIFLLNDCFFAALGTTQDLHVKTLLFCEKYITTNL